MNVASVRPFVSVIVPVYNNAERLVLCLESLERQTYLRDRYQSS
jgi:glycosyltransferase involved in cell wall biosynthesis